MFRGLQWLGNRKDHSPIWGQAGGAATGLEAPPQGRADSRQSDQQRPLVPFVRAAHHHTEGPFFQTTVTPGTNAQVLGPFDVPAYGFVRNIWILVSGSGGALGGGALNADYPWNIFSNISLTDPNSNNLFYPQTGYQAYLANLTGGYVFSTDPAAAPGYVGDIVTPQFAIRIPVEITPWDAFGSLANQNAASAYKVNLTVNTLANLVTGGSPTGPACVISGYLEAWSAPAAMDLLQNPQQTLPPGLGTTQFWSPYVPVVAAGQQTIRLTKVGNLIRNLVLVFRTTAGVRSNTVPPDPIRIVWDSADLFNEALAYRRKVAYEQVGVAMPTGVLLYSFTDDQDGHAGFENRNLWLPTVQATRLEVQGSFGAAGTMEILTNDVAVTPAGR